MILKEVKRQEQTELTVQIINHVGMFPDMPWLPSYIKVCDQGVVKLTIYSLFCKSNQLTLEEPYVNRPYALYDVLMRNHYEGTQVDPAVEYAIVLSETSLQHPQAEKAKFTADSLVQIYNPWGIVRPVTEKLIRKLGYDKLPPVVAIVASEGEFPSTDKFGHGRYISSAVRGLRIGAINDPKYLFFATVWGSRIWGEGLLNTSEQVASVQIHELSHLLESAFFIGENILTGEHLEGDLPINTTISRPGWEALADLLRCQFTFLKDQETAYQTGKLTITYDQLALINTIRINRFLGEVPDLLNTLFYGLALRAWMGESLTEMTFNDFKNQQAAEAFLEKCFGRIFDYPTQEPPGWLIKQAFADKGYNWTLITNEIKQMSLRQMKNYIEPLNDGSCPILYQHLINIFQQYASNWIPTGEDSLKK